MKETMMGRGLVPEYPKIETIFDRDPSNMKHVLYGTMRCPEFAAVNRWRVTEKIDGTNVRVALLEDDTVFYGGRTDDAQMPPHLLEYLRATFTRERLVAALRVDDDRPVVTLYGEGYGAKIQGGVSYRSSVNFRLFDARSGSWWLQWDTLEDIAQKLGIACVPCFGTMTTAEALDRVWMNSIVAGREGGIHSHPAEGIVAQSEPMLLSRMGRRVMWKLKKRDLP